MLGRHILHITSQQCLQCFYLKPKLFLFSQIQNAFDDIYGMTAPDWSLALQQVMLFVLILGRWLGPKGQISRDQLSQLLLVYIGMAADILEFITEGLINPVVMCNETHQFILLTIWSWSLFQFTLSLTATKTKSNKKSCGNNCLFFETEMWSIVLTTFMQDGPYLGTRLYFMIKFHSITQASLFFTFKNALLLMIQTYRIVIIVSNNCKADAKKIDAEQPEEGEREIIDMHGDDSLDKPPSARLWPDFSQTTVHLRRFIEKTSINMRFRGRQGFTSSQSNGDIPSLDKYRETGKEMVSVISDKGHNFNIQKSSSQVPLCAQPGGDELSIECSRSSEDVEESFNLFTVIDSRLRKYFKSSNAQAQNQRISGPSDNGESATQGGKENVEGHQNDAFIEENN